MESASLDAGLVSLKSSLAKDVENGKINRNKTEGTTSVSLKSEGGIGFAGYEISLSLEHTDYNPAPENYEEIFPYLESLDKTATQDNLSPIRIPIEINRIDNTSINYSN